MKLRLRISKAPPPRPRLQPPKDLKLPASLLEDPAFSTDPQSHPYFPKEGSEWTLPPLPGHPYLKGRRRQRQPSRTSPDNNLSDSDSDGRLIQPPNSPMLLSRANSRAHGISTSAAIESSTKLPENPILSQPKAMQQPEPGRPTFVKKLGLLTKKRRVGKEHKSSKSYDGHAPVETSGRREPQLQRHNSAPEPVARREDAPVRLEITTAKEARTANSKAQPLQITKHDLDRIDELDETNIFGVSLHHDGPYEAVKAVLASPSRMPLGYQNDGRLHNYHERMLKSTGHIYEVPVVPNDMPLNLTPGQTLPRNFKREQRKAPRFRNFVAPLPTQQELPEEEHSAEPVVAPRHQKFNQIPFHNNSTRNGRRKGPRADDNPLDGPPIDPSVIIGLAMLREASETATLDSAVKEIPVDDEVNPVVETKEEDPLEVDQEGSEFDPYDPRHLDAHPAALEDHNEDEDDDADTSSLAYAQSHKHFSEQDFHAGDTDAATLNLQLQFGGIPAGVQVTLHPETTQRDHSPSPRPALRHGGSEETLVQRDDDIDNVLNASVNSHGTVKPDIIVSKESGVLRVQVQAADPQSPKEKDVDQEIVGASLSISVPISQVVTNPVDIHPDVPSESIADDVVSSTGSHPTNRRYDKQLPPPPPQVMAVGSPPPYTPEPTYILPQHRGNSTESLNGQYKPSQKSLQRNDSTRSTQLSANSFKSYSSTKGEDGHSNVSSNVKPPSASVPQRKPSSNKPPYTIPILSGYGSETYNRYPQPAAPAAPKRPSPVPEQRTSSRTQSRNGSSVTSSSRSQLSPIREDEADTTTAVKKLSPLSHNIPRIQPSRSDFKPKKSASSSSAPAYGSHTRIEVGQLYPKHMMSPSSVPLTSQPSQPPRIHKASSSSRTHSSSHDQQGRPPLAPVPQVSAPFNGGRPTEMRDDRGFPIEPRAHVIQYPPAVPHSKQDGRGIPTESRGPTAPYPPAPHNTHDARSFPAESHGSRSPNPPVPHSMHDARSFPSESHGSRVAIPPVPHGMHDARSIPAEARGPTVPYPPPVSHSMHDARNNPAESRGGSTVPYPSPAPHSMHDARNYPPESHGSRTPNPPATHSMHDARSFPVQSHGSRSPNPPVPHSMHDARNFPAESHGSRVPKSSSVPRPTPSPRIEDQVPVTQNIPTDTPRTSSEDSEHRPLRVVNSPSSSPEGREQVDPKASPSYGGAQNTAPESVSPRYQADNASSIRPEDSASNRARSITSYAPSTMTMRLPHLNRHLPKKLVMPTPLQPMHENMIQQQAANSTQLYKDIFRPRPPPSTISQIPPPRDSSYPLSREPSPPHILPPILSHDHKAESQAPSRKLKKRLSQVPALRIGEFAPTEALNFEPKIIPPDRRPIKVGGKPSSSRLSKRRTNL